MCIPIPDDAAFGCGTHHAFTAKSENVPQYFRHVTAHVITGQTKPLRVSPGIVYFHHIPTLSMKIFYAMLGAVVLAGSAAAFTRQSAPSIIRRSTTIAMASPIDFAKSEIASNDVSGDRQEATMGHSCFCVWSLLTHSETHISLVLTFTNTSDILHVLSLRCTTYLSLP